MAENGQNGVAGELRSARTGRRSLKRRGCLRVVWELVGSVSVVWEGLTPSAKPRKESRKVRRKVRRKVVPSHKKVGSFLLEFPTPPSGRKVSYRKVGFLRGLVEGVITKK